MRRIQSASNSGLGAFFILPGTKCAFGPAVSDSEKRLGKNYIVAGLASFGLAAMHPCGGTAFWVRPGVRGGRLFVMSKRFLAKNSPIGLYNPLTRSLMAGDMQITCSDCGQDFTFSSADQQFFQERGYSTPKRCKPCRQAKKDDQGGSGYRSAPSQGTPVICSGCGQPTTVPFEPRGDRPVYCRDCYTARKGTGGGGGRGR